MPDSSLWNSSPFFCPFEWKIFSKFIFFIIRTQLRDLIERSTWNFTVLCFTQLLVNWAMGGHQRDMSSCPSLQPKLTCSSSRSFCKKGRTQKWEATLQLSRQKWLGKQQKWGVRPQKADLEEKTQVVINARYRLRQRQESQVGYQ